MSIRTWGIGLAAAGAVALASVLPASAAFAGGGGNPYPTPTATCTTPAPNGNPTINPNISIGVSPCPTPTQPVPPACPLFNAAGIPIPLVAGENLTACPRIAQEDFGFTDTNLNPDGFVTATGPIRFSPFVFGLRGRAFVVSDILDRLAALFGSVNLHGEPIAATVDLASCSLVVDQRDLPWYILARTGTGIYRNDEGAGFYSEAGVFSFASRGFTCTLPAGLTSAQASWDLNHGLVGLPVPLDYGLTVNGTGWVAPNPLVVPSPSPTPTYTYPVSGYSY